MGSLPNLHELDRPQSTGHQQYHQHQKVGPMISGPAENYYYYQQHGPGPGPGSGPGPGPQPVLTQEERNRILHRHSSHCRGGVKLRCNVAGAGAGAGGSVKGGYYDYMYSPILPSSHQTRLHLPQRAGTIGSCSSTSTSAPGRGHLQLQRTQSRGRRDSVNSSIGANSVRRLIAVVRGTHGRLGPIYSRRVLLKNLAAMCCTHALATGAMLPFLALQGSMSVWIHPSALTSPYNTTTSPPSTTTSTLNAGPHLLVLLHLAAAAACPAAPYLIRKLPPNYLLAIAYFGLSAFFAVHLYPHVGILLAAYCVAGVMVGPATVCRLQSLMTISVKISQIFGDDEDDTKLRRRAIIVRRVARTFQAAHDFGLILGSLLSALIVTYTITWYHDGGTQLYVKSVNTSNVATNCSVGDVECEMPAGYNRSRFNVTTYDYYTSLLDTVFSTDELGDRICGANACPPTPTGPPPPHHLLPPTTLQSLAIAYSMLCTAASVCALACLDRIKSPVAQDMLERGAGSRALGAVIESFRDRRLKMAAPLAVFVGMEQAFMFADFSQSYVVCTLGIHRLNLVFLCMGLLQSVAACTLSMLMRTIKRYYVIAVGFAFHACLLMVQLVWKPLGDDPALFYVISAAWGVCNAVWEMLNFTLITTMYTDGYEVPFANSCCFRYLGMAVTFALHAQLCTWVKLYVLGAAMLAAIVPLLWLEAQLQQQQKEQRGHRRSQQQQQQQQQQGGNQQLAVGTLS